jgi:prophage regulatory protein
MLLTGKLLFARLLVLHSLGVLTMTNRILRFPEVAARTGLSRSRLYQAMSEGTFPSSISIGARAIGWIEAEVTAWIDYQIEESRRFEGGSHADI